MKISDVKHLHTSEWLVLKQASCINEHGQDFNWNYISRKNDQNVVLLLCHSSDSQKILLLKEFRVPMNKWVIEFPKGLIKIDETIEDAALRELKEETGYDGKLIKAHPFLATCAYLTNEKTSIVEIEVNESKLGATNYEAAEEIIPFWVQKETLEQKMHEFQKNDFIIENNVWFYSKAYKH